MRAYVPGLCSVCGRALWGEGKRMGDTFMPKFVVCRTPTCSNQGIACEPLTIEMTALKVER